MPNYADVKVADLKFWTDNPRNITDYDFDRLKKSIALGEHTPLLVTPDGVVLGGNMRLRAYQELGVDTASASVLDVDEVDGKFYAILNGDRKDRAFDSKEQLYVTYALSHNDTFGEYVEPQLAELATRHNIDLELHSINLGRPRPLKDMPSLSESPAAEDVEPEDLETSKKCPKCGFEF